MMDPESEILEGILASDLASWYQYFIPKSLCPCHTQTDTILFSFCGARVCGYILCISVEKIAPVEIICKLVTNDILVITNYKDFTRKSNYSRWWVRVSEYHRRVVSAEKATSYSFNICT
ncbi:hypothetical protein Dimus_035180 [Dionaea muscipula]